MNQEKISLEISKYQEVLAKDDFFTRLFQNDLTLWNPADHESISQRLGWLSPINFLKNESDHLHRLQNHLNAKQPKHVVHLGMGGSSLFADVISAFSPSDTYHILDTLDLDHIRSVLEQIEPENTWVVVASKSGTTAEVLTLLQFFIEIIPDPSQYIVITDPESPLATDARFKEGAYALLNPANIGGRFSCFSYFGILPALLCNWTMENIAQHLQTIEDHLSEVVTEAGNRACFLAAHIKLGATCFQFKNVQNIGAQKYVDWVQQLIAESTGKKGSGILPLSFPEDAAGHISADYLMAKAVFRQENADKGAADLLSLPEPSPGNLFIELYTWMLATTALGYLTRVNPFDEPDVNAAKQYTRAFLENPNAPALTLTESAPLDLPQSNLSYASILYFGNRLEIPACLKTFQKHLIQTYRIPCSLEYGPRYLHSTGQFYKGGPKSGLIVLVGPSEEKTAKKPSEEQITQLKRAQIKGDHHALKAAGQRCFYFSLAGVKKQMEHLL